MDGDAPVADETDLLSKRAEVFRSKLISDFHLLESISEVGSRVEAPRYYTGDLLGGPSFVMLISLIYRNLYGYRKHVICL